MTLYTTIVKHLRDTPMSLAELQAALPVSPPTLRKVVQDLADDRWVRVVGRANTNGGRPAMLFGIDNDYYLLLGIQLQLPGMRLIACDLSGRVIDESTAFQNETPRPDQVIQTVTDYVQAIRNRFTGRELLGIGLASPGFTDPVTGDIITINRVLGWHNVPICNHLSTLAGLPVKIANDVDCMAFAEFQHAGITLDKNLAYLGFDEGAKISMFLGGDLYKGSLGNTGLIVTDLLNLHKRFSREEYRQILTISGINRLFTQRLAAFDSAAQRPYAAIVADHSPWQHFQSILQGAVEGLPICEEIVQVFTTTLATAIANVVLVIQPDTLIIGGALSAMPPQLIADLENEIRQMLPTLFTNRLIIQQAKLSTTNSAPIGAAIHLLNEYLASSSIDLARQKYISDAHRS
jgi:predicted NBD/HSP70 family sugar kinase